MRPLEGPPQPFGWFALNSDDITMIAEAAQKYFLWSETAANEKLDVQKKSGEHHKSPRFGYHKRTWRRVVEFNKQRSFRDYI
jgi:hypothetical protein